VRFWLPRTNAALFILLSLPQSVGSVRVIVLSTAVSSNSNLLHAQQQQLHLRFKKTVAVCMLNAAGVSAIKGEKTTNIMLFL
jgi:hypothetical protein